MAATIGVGILLVFSAMHLVCSGFTNGDCSTSTFRVFYLTDLDDLDSLSPRERLAFAAKPGERHVVRMTRSLQLGIAQEDANVNIDCLPWLSRFPGGSIRWYFIQLDDFGSIVDPTFPPLWIAPNDNVIPPERLIVGGESNRWLNITRVEVIGGAEDPDSKIFMCEVCVNRTECHSANYTSRVIGAPPVIINGTSPIYIDVVRNSEALATLVLLLECAIDDTRIPRPVPLPILSWFKDGELISSAQSGQNFQIEESYVMANPILTRGVFDFSVLTVLNDGTVALTTSVTNITLRALGMIPLDTTLEQARELLLNTFLGNWTCVVNNSLGSSSVEYIVGEFADFILPAIEVGWLDDLVAWREMGEFYFLPVGVRRGAELLQENITFSVEGTNSSDFTLLTTTIELTPPFTSPELIYIFLSEDKVANEENETVHLRLVPVTTLNQRGIVLHDNITLTILDDDRVTLSFSKAEYTVSESDSAVVVQLTKNKPLANHLEVVVTALTLEEADFLGCLPLNTSLKQADVNKDFNSTSYFSSPAIFLADEGETPTNQLNISIPLIDDDILEDRESFVVTIELLPLCGTGALVDVQQRSSLIHIIDNDSCESDTTILPLNNSVLWPRTLAGESISVQCPNSSSDIIVTRPCGEDGQWLEPDHYQDCSNAILGEGFSRILEEINQTSLGATAAAQVAQSLRHVTQIATENGAGQNRENLEVITKIFDRLAQSTANEQVVLEVVSVLDHLSDWPRDVVQRTSSDIVQSFEAIATNLTGQMNFTILRSVTEDIIFHAERRDVEELLENGKSVNFNSKQGVSSTSSADDLSYISLPSSLFGTLRNQSALLDQIGLVYTSYSTAVLFPLTPSNSTDNSTISFIGSSVLGASVVAEQTDVRNLTDPIVMEFKVNGSMMQNALSVQCVSWEFEAAGGRGNWTSEGCRAIDSNNDNTVKCHCNHLTNFAILVEICARTGGCEEPDPIYSLILEISSLIGVCLSIGGLLLAILTQLILMIKKSRSSKEREKQSAIQYKFYIQLCFALLCMYIVFLVGIDRTEHYIGCVVASVLLHYFTLAAVLWMSAICAFLFWIMVVNPFAKASFNSCHMTIVTLICWVVPVVPVVIPVAIDRDFVVAYSNNQPQELQFCFIKDQVVFFAAFLGPLFLLVLMNAVMFVCITFVQLRYVCCTHRQRTQDAKDGSKSTNLGENFMIVLKLWCILCLFGLTWLFGALTITRTASYIFSTLFAIFSSLQGFFIFVFLCLLSKDALQTYKQICCSKRGRTSTISEPGRESNKYSTKSSGLVSKDLYQGYKPAHDDAVKLAFSQELSTKVKLYDHEVGVGDEVKTSTFKPS